MAKKNRTGLQSEISHIFAGVPMPKRRRSRSDIPKKKPKSEEPEQIKDEKPLVEESPVQKLPEEQPVQPEISKEKMPVTESLNEVSSAPKAPVEQEQAKEIPVENLIAPQSQVEEIPVGQPPVIEPPVEEPSAPFEQAIELLEPEEPLGTIQELPSVRPVKRSVTEPSVVKVPRKVQVTSKGKRAASKTGLKSRKRTIQVIVLIAFSVLLVFLLVNQFSKTSSDTGLGGSDVTIPQISPGADIESVVVDWEKPPAYPVDIRNPMILGKGPNAYISWVPDLTGIVYTENQKNAIIGAYILEEGEEINGVKIVKINRDSVVFERDGQRWTQEVQSNR